jgi:hypothetical protein
MMMAGDAEARGNKASEPLTSLLSRLGDARQRLEGSYGRGG